MSEIVNLGRTTAEQDVKNAHQFLLRIKRKIRKKASLGESICKISACDKSDRVISNTKKVLEDRGFRVEVYNTELLKISWSDYADSFFKELIRGGQNCSVCGVSNKPFVKTNSLRGVVTTTLLCLLLLAINVVLCVLLY